MKRVRKIKNLLSLVFIGLIFLFGMINPFKSQAQSKIIENEIVFEVESYSIYQIDSTKLKDSIYKSFFDLHQKLKTDSLNKFLFPRMNRNREQKNKSPADENPYKLNWIAIIPNKDDRQR